MSIHIQTVFTCDLCGRVLFERFLWNHRDELPYLWGHSDSRNMENGETWRYVMGRYVCGAHAVQVETRIDGRLVV